MTLPVAVISFNRPGYLAQVLDSLRHQTFPVDEIALFQDGARRGVDLEKIHDCDSVFRKVFPGGKVFQHPFNIGPGLNIARAERWLFEELEAEAGIILEDDLVLSRHYIETLQAMLDANCADDRLAMVSAYGSILSKAVSDDTYAPMHLNWGFAATRRQWLLRKPYVDAYLGILRTDDYRHRDIVAIMKLRDEWGLPGASTTQDVMRSAAAHKVGGIRLGTRDHFARYIGANGLHIDQKTYDAAGFAKWKICTKFPSFGPVSDEMVRNCRDLTEKFIGLESMVVA